MMLLFILKLIYVAFSLKFAYSIETIIMDSAENVDLTTLDHRILNSQLQNLMGPSADESQPGFESVILPENCSLAFDHFTNTFVNLTQCTLRYARPIRICTQCEIIYNASVEAYNQLKAQGSECDAYYFSSDQLRIVDHAYNDARKLWSKSFCQNCYLNVNDTKAFFEASKELAMCIRNTNASTPTLSANSTCEKCRKFYDEIAEIYRKFVTKEEAYDDGVCVDLVDTMNSSRTLWLEYRCFVVFDEYIGYSTIFTCLIFGATPVLFYLLARNVSRIEDVKIVRPKRKFTVFVNSDQAPTRNSASAVVT